MKKTENIFTKRLLAYVISFAIVFSFLITSGVASTSVSAAVVDDSSDGVFEWSGFSWDATCMHGSETTSTACEHGYMYIDDENRFNFRLVPNAEHHYTKLDMKKNGQTFTSSFDVEFDMKIDSFGEGMGFQICTGKGKRIYFIIEDNGISFQNDVGTYDQSMGYFHEINIGNDWRNWRFEIRDNDHMYLYLDDEMVFSNGLASLNAEAQVLFYIGASTNVAPQIEAKNFVITKYDEAVTMTPAEEEVFQLGGTIELCASVSGSPETVDYFMGNVKIGTATADDGYKYSLSGLDIGSYNVRAVASDGQYAFPRTFRVEDSGRTVSLTVPENISHGSVAEITFNNPSGLDVSKVAYYLNGKLQTTVETAPFGCSLSNLRVGTSSIFATALLADGTTDTSDEMFVNVTATSNGNFEMAQEYTTDYTFESGMGAIEINDGYFRCSMIHDNDGITFDSRDKTGETYALTTGGAGKYKIVIASGVAEVYRNGQFIFSYYMPNSSKAPGLSHSGVSDLRLSGSGVKNELFRYEIGSEETEITEENIVVEPYYSLEFDKMDASGETIVFYDGEYEINLKFNGKVSALVQNETDLEIKESVLSDEVTAGYYRLTVYRGLAQLFKDNKFVASFRAPKMVHRTMLHRAMSTSGQSNFISLKNTDDVYYFEEDFSKTNELDPLEYWYNTYGTTKATVSNGSMYLSGAGTYILDATAENPQIEWDMNVIDPSWNGSLFSSQSKSMALALRYRGEYECVKLRYTHTVSKLLGITAQSGKWEIVEVMDGKETVLASSANKMTLDSNQHFVLSVKDDKLTLKCGNTTIFDGISLTFRGNGKFGFNLGDLNAIYIDNISYMGNGKVNSGVNYWYWTGLSGWPEIWEGDSEDEVVAAFLSNTISKTTDNGATWSTPESFSGPVLSGNTIKLKSGNILSTNERSTVNEYSTAYLYDAEWNLLNKSQIQNNSDGRLNRFASDTRLTQGRKIWGTAVDAQPRIYLAFNYGAENNGNTYFYYSDDDGRTWKSTTTVLNYETLGNMVNAEADVVELPDGTVRLYMRTDFGFLYMIDSFDGGVSFDKSTLKASQFHSATTMFSVDRDEDEDNVYYMLWEYDITTADPRIQTPRNRTALAVSYDGCETWEYIMEMDDRGPVSEVSHNNNTLRVAHGVVYATLSHASWQMDAERMLGKVTHAVNPANMKTLKRFTNAHYVDPKYTSFYEISALHSTLPKTTGAAMIGGILYPTRVDESGFVEYSIAAKAVGAVGNSTENGVRVSVGDGYVDFTKGSASYSINGVAKTADAVCLSEDGEYVNVKVLADIFGRTYAENETTHMLLSLDMGDKHKTELGNLAGNSISMFETCIESFKAVSSWQELKTFFEDYKYFLNIYSDFSDASFVNMYGAYTTLVFDEIIDFTSLSAAVRMLIGAEKGKVEEFLAELNEASQNGDVELIEQLLTEKYADLLSFTVDTSALKNKTAAFDKMTGLVYSSVVEVENVYLSAYEVQLRMESGKNDEIVISTASRGFEFWNELSESTHGGLNEYVQNGENIANLSAFGKMETDKESVENSPRRVLVYQTPGNFGSNVSNSGVDFAADAGTATFNGSTATVNVKGTEKTQTNTMVTEFDLTKPEGTITVTLRTGNKKAEISLTADGASAGELSDKLKNAEKLTYRIEMSLANVAVYAKSADALDNEYELLGTTTSTNVTSAFWSVAFASQDAVAQLSNVGVYSALPSVRYETSGYVLIDSYQFTANGTEGNSMEDLLSLGYPVINNNIYVDSETGNIVMAKNEGDTNSVISFENTYSTLKEPFDRSELDFTVSVETDGNLFLYLCDGTGYRYKTSKFAPNFFDNTSSNVGSNMTWQTGQFYDFKLITTVVEGDGTKNETVASLFVKKAEDEEWLCLALDQPLTNKDTSYTANNQIKFLNQVVDKNIYFSNISIKTYKRTTGDMSYVNTAVDMPEGDYYYSFDYERMDSDSDVEFVIGGDEYYQSFMLYSDRVMSSETENVIADVDFDSNSWYRIFGKVTITAETAHPYDKSKMVKNKISMYMTDSNGNTVTLFENLPMLKESGKNGIRFNVSDCYTGGIELKNIRVYCGRVLDVISCTMTDGSVAVKADLLNSDAMLDGTSIAYVGVYGNDVMLNAKSTEITESVEPYGIYRVEPEKVIFEASNGVDVKVKLFLWHGSENYVPVTKAVSIDK